VLGLLAPGVGMGGGSATAPVVFVYGPLASVFGQVVLDGGAAGDVVVGGE
jgi:hypothetical protein